MGIWIGVGLIFTSALLVALQMLHINAERIDKEFYKIHLSISTVAHTIGTVICVLTIRVEGVWLAIYAIVMFGAMVFLWVSQKKNYDNAMRLQESRDRLNEFMRGE